MCCHKRACPARVSAEVDRSTKVISKPTTPTEPHRWLHGGTGLKSPNVMVASRLLVGVGDALDSARANAELLGDLVQPWATRSSQCITDAPFQLGVDEGPTAVLATGLGPSNARIHPLADHCALELGEHAHHLEHGLARRRRGVDALLMQEQVDAKAVQLGEEAAEVLQRAAGAIATQLSDAVNRCVIDVRDKTSKYETSPNYRSLGRIALQYIDAGGLKDSTACRADRIAEAARARAWMALAVSKSGDPGLTIW